MHHPRGFRAVWRFVGLSLIALGAVLPHTLPPKTALAQNQDQDQAQNEAIAPQTATPNLAPSLATVPAGLLNLPGAQSGLKVGVIPVAGTIDRFTFTMLQRKAEQAVQEGCAVLVLEVDTFGGRADWALEISRYIKSLTARGVYTVAWINSKAYSAGILISAACQQIIVAPGAQAGDCAPIIPGAELKPTERAKALTPLLAEFRDSGGIAKYAAYQAMCVLGVEVYLIEQPDTGKRLLVNQVDKAMMVDGLARNEAEKQFGDDSGGANGVGSASNAVAMDEDLGAWTLVEQLPSGDPLPGARVHDGKTLLTVSGKQAVDIGLSEGAVATDQQVAQYTQAGEVVRYRKTWIEPVAEFLLHPVVRTVLVLTMFVGFYLELNAPGMVLPGVLALIALGGLLIAPFVLGLAAVWHVLVFLIGLALLVIELLLTPTFGVLGAVGVVGMLIGLVFSVLPNTAGGPSGGGGVNTDVLWVYSLSLAAALLLTGITIGILTKYFGTLPVLSKLALESVDRDNMDPAQTHIEGEEVLGIGFLKIGMTGITTTDLRPAGQVDIDGHLIDVVSDGGFVDKGTAIQVIDTSSNRVMVAAAPAPAPGSNNTNTTS